MTRIISIVNHHSGVGKTTTAVNLGAYLSSAGKAVLLVDLDPRGHATHHLGVHHRDVRQGVADALATDTGFENVLVKTMTEHSALYHLAPATPRPAPADDKLKNHAHREHRLLHELRRIEGQYDYILIDTAPSLDLLLENGLIASSEVLIPIQADATGFEGLEQLFDMISRVQNTQNRDIRVLGVLRTHEDRTARHSRRVHQEIREHFPRKVFSTAIPRSTQFKEASGHGLTIDRYDPNSAAAAAYARVAQEVLETERTRTPSIWERIGV